MNSYNEDKLISLANDLYWEISQDWGINSDVVDAIEDIIVSSDIKSAKSFAEEIKQEMINYDIWGVPSYRKLWNKIKNYKLINESAADDAVDWYGIFYAAIDRLYGEDFLMPQLSNIYENGVNEITYNLILNDSLFDDNFSDEERSAIMDIMQQAAGDYIIDEIHSINNKKYRNDYYDIFYTFFAQRYIGRKMVQSDKLNKRRVLSRVFGEYLNDITNNSKIDNDLAKAFKEIKADITEFGHNVLQESADLNVNRDDYNEHSLNESKCPKDGCIQRKKNNKWGVISAKTGKFWKADYDTKADAEAGLRAYHVNESDDEEIYMIIYANDFFTINDIKKFIIIFKDDIIYEDENQIEFYTRDWKDIQDELDHHGIEWDMDKNY